MMLVWTSVLYISSALVNLCVLKILEFTLQSSHAGDFRGFLLQADLNEQKKSWRDSEMELSDRAKLYLKRLFINLVVICLLAGAMYLIVFTVEEMLKVSIVSCVSTSNLQQSFILFINL